MFAPEATLASSLMDCKSANHWALIIGESPTNSLGRHEIGFMSE